MLTQEPSIGASRVLTIAAAAAALGISKRTLEREIQAEKIRSVKLSARRRGIPTEEVDRIISGTVAA